MVVVDQGTCQVEVLTQMHSRELAHSITTMKGMAMEHLQQ